MTRIWKDLIRGLLSTLHRDIINRNRGSVKVRLNKDKLYGWAPPLAIKYKEKTYQWKSKDDLLDLPDGDPALKNVIKSKRWHPGGSCCKTVQWLIVV